MGALTTLLAIAGTLATFVTASPLRLMLNAAAFNASDLIVTSLESYSPSDASAATTNAYIRFFLSYDDPLGPSNTQCGAQWNVLNGSAPTSFFDCQNSSYAWQVENFVSISQFTLDTKHWFKDPSVGEPPMDSVTVWAKGDFGPANLTCTDAADGSTTCGLINGTQAHLPIYQAIA